MELRAIGRFGHKIRRQIATTCTTAAAELPGARARLEQLVLDYDSVGPSNIRNFAIVAHVDHGKSTLADRLLEVTGTIHHLHCDEQQFLDKLQVERERGITVKAQSASMLHRHTDGVQYMLNLIDTPGHVDFAYEVHRSLSAADAVLLVVDAKQGIQAQTVANFWACFERGLTIIPVLNKIDLPNARPAVIAQNIQSMFDIPADECVAVSAKTGQNIEALLSTIIERCPPPPLVDRSLPTRARIVDSTFDRYTGAMALVYVMQGEIRPGDILTSGRTMQTYTVGEVGVLREKQLTLPSLRAGYCLCNMRTVAEAHIGDVLFDGRDEVYATEVRKEEVDTFVQPKQSVYAGLYPLNPTDFDRLRGAVEQLVLNDSSVSLVVDRSPALGLGWRMGFLGLLHLEVFTERLSNEYDESVIVTQPSVAYRAHIKDVAGIRKRYDNKDVYDIRDPLLFPVKTDVSMYTEPLSRVTIISPMKFEGAVRTLCEERRGEQMTAETLDGHRIMFEYDMPTAEIVVDFCDVLKRVSSGYASFDFVPHGHIQSDLVRMDVKVNDVVTPALSVVMNRAQARKRARTIVDRLAEDIDQQQFEVAIDAVIGGKVLASSTIAAFKKDFSDKMKGNMRDRTRVMKQLKFQERGKARMKEKMVGRVPIPKHAFIRLLTR